MQHLPVYFCIISCALLSPPALTAMEPIVSVQRESFTTSALAVVTPGDRSFRTLVTSQFGGTIPPDMEALLPFSVVIRNLSSERIIAYTLRWECIDASEQKSLHDRTTWNPFTLKGGDVIEPNGYRFVSPVYRPELTPLNNWPLQKQRIEKELSTLKPKRSVAISVDTVVLSNGTVLGLDRSRTSLHFRARLTAEQDVFKAIVERQSDGFDAITALLRQVSAERSLISKGPDSDGDWYSRWYAAYAVDTADRILRALEQRDGLSLVLDHVNKTLNNRPLPSFHR